MKSLRWTENPKESGQYRSPPQKNYIVIYMNLMGTTKIEVALYLVMVLSIIGLIVGACVGNEIIMNITAGLIFGIIFVFLGLNTYRNIKYKNKR